MFTAVIKPRSGNIVLLQLWRHGSPSLFKKKTDRYVPCQNTIKNTTPSLRNTLGSNLMALCEYVLVYLEAEKLMTCNEGYI